MKFEGNASEFGIPKWKNLVSWRLGGETVKGRGKEEVGRKKNIEYRISKFEV